MDTKVIQIPALGRPLYLGMLYDCRNDSFIPGVTLWDREVLIKDLDVHAKPNTEFKITSSDSIKEKLSLLDVSASLKASFLAGLVEVGGSAKYLNNMTSSKRQCRVTMHYSTTNRFEQLTMSQLGKMVYPQVFEQQTATHIIMAVLYGAQAFFVFDQMASEEKTKQLIEGNLNVMVKKIPNFSIEGKGALKMTDKDKESVQKFSCTFHGDFEIKHNPTTYLEALDVYKTLPGLLGEKREKEVPVRVWLYPLEHLDSEAAKLVQEISVSLVSGAETVLEELNEVSMRCNDMTSDGFIRHFSDLKEKLYQFQGLFLQYKPVFQKALSRLLPSIKGGRLEEQVLADVLQSHKQSPFSSHLLEKWLNEKESEIDILRLYTDTMKDIPIMSSEGQLNKVLFDPKIDTVICFTFTSLFYDEPYLTVLMQYLHSEEFKKLQKLTNFIKNVETQPWFTSSTLSATMRVNLESFRGFAEANKDDKKTSFLIASVSDRSCPGASIYLYCRGKLMNPQFQPVSKPNPPVSTDTQPDRVTLKLLPSQTGETERYRVEYRAVQRGAQTEGQWTVTDTPDTQGTWTLSGLQAGTLYQIRYRSVSAVGVSEASEAIEIQTKPNPRGPEELSIKRVGLQAVQVTWKEPASEEERRSVLRYRVEYKNDRWEEWVAKLSKPGECVCTLVGLKYSNLYRVRVSAVFTEAETSATSQEAEVPPMQGSCVRMSELSEEMVAELLSLKKRNLIKNPHGAEQFEGWEITKNGGCQWRVEELPGDCGKEFPDKTVQSYFATSFALCLKKQVLDLRAEGYSEELLDTVQPKITVQDWYAGRLDCGCIYQLCVSLLNESQETVQEFKPDPVSLEPENSDCSWSQVTHTFEGYGPGVRFVSFEHGGQDSKYWKGWFGVRVTNSSVEVQP